MKLEPTDNESEILNSLGIVFDLGNFGETEEDLVEDLIGDIFSKLDKAIVI